MPKRLYSTELVSFYAIHFYLLAHVEALHFESMPIFRTTENSLYRSLPYNHRGGTHAPLTDGCHDAATTISKAKVHLDAFLAFILFVPRASSSGGVKKTEANVVTWAGASGAAACLVPTNRSQ